MAKHVSHATLVNCCHFVYLTESLWSEWHSKQTGLICRLCSKKIVYFIHIFFFINDFSTESFKVRKPLVLAKSGRFNHKETFLYDKKLYTISVLMNRNMNFVFFFSKFAYKNNQQNVKPQLKRKKNLRRTYFFSFYST